MKLVSATTFIVALSSTNLSARPSVGGDELAEATSTVATTTTTAATDTTGAAEPAKLAGEYTVFYTEEGKAVDQRPEEHNLVLGCEGSFVQQGIFMDKMHFEDVKTKCTDPRAEHASFWVDYGGGAVASAENKGKFECLHVAEDGALKGAHYIPGENGGKPAFWGLVEYKRKSTTNCQAEKLAGIYSVSYKGEPRPSHNMTLGCDGTFSQFGVFNDSMHYDQLQTKCTAEGAGAAFWVDYKAKDGAGKFECLHEAGASNSLKGAHFLPGPKFWGTVEYSRLEKIECKQTTPAGTYSVSYKGPGETVFTKRPDENNLELLCNGEFKQTGIFEDTMHRNVSKCSVLPYGQAATFWIEYDKSKGKFECLHMEYEDGKPGNPPTIRGSHYIDLGKYWGAVEYTQIKATVCGETGR